MRILVIGGHGKVARLLHPLLVEHGHEAVAVIRNPGHRDEVADDGATPLVADVESMSTDQLTDLIRGSDAVVWSAGAGGGNPARTYAVDRDAAVRSIDAAAAAGVRRYVMVSYFGAGPDHGVPQEDPFYAYADAKTAADTHLQDSDLHWTLLRPSRLTDDPPTGNIETSIEGATKGEVPRADVSAVIAEVLARPRTAGAIIEFNSGDAPIGEAIAAFES